MSCAKVVHIVPFKSTAAIELRLLRNGITGEYENGASVDVTLRDNTGADLAGVAWPLSMPYVAGSDGGYRAILSHDLMIVVDEDYTAIIEAEDSAGSQGYWEATVRVKIRAK